jgi:hypothetical protein
MHPLISGYTRNSTESHQEDETMAMKFRMFALILLALGPIAMGANPVHAQDQQVPFSGSYSGTVSFTSDQNVVLLDGTGRATHLGRSTTEGTVTITGPVVDGCPGGIANVNTETLTAANGDTITLTVEDVACPEGPGLFHGTGEWEVTEGTGRFSGATGHGTFDGHINLVEGRFTFDLSGTISAPNGH